MSSPARLTATEFKARNAEHKVLQATSSRQAFAASIRAAELYMQALKLADNPTDRSRLEAKCKDLLDRSEQFKEQSTHTGPNGSLNARDSDRPYQVRRDRKEPLSNRALTTREKIILVEGSKLNGFKFPIWEQPPKDAEFELNDGQQQFVDSPPLQLSALQLESFGGWKRPKEALAGIEIIRDGQKLPNDPTMESADRIDLVQDMTSDCSVVASLCAGSSRAERGHPKVGYHGLPSLAANGCRSCRLSYTPITRKTRGPNYQPPDAMSFDCFLTDVTAEWKLTISYQPLTARAFCTC